MHHETNCPARRSARSLRASVHIGELIRELETAQPTHTGAGLNNGTAYRYEELVG
jgi:hypothetical protein